MHAAAQMCMKNNLTAPWPMTLGVVITTGQIEIMWLWQLSNRSYLLAGVAAVVVEQANTCLALSRANANSTVLGTLTLADAGNKFINFLAAVGFRVSYCNRLRQF